MSAGPLREAARLMRERAEASQTAIGYAPWHVDGPDENGQYVVVPVVQRRVAADLTEGDAAHIASWSPAVALAVADWLDRITVGVDGPADDWPHPLDVSAALAVARAYLGETS